MKIKQKKGALINNLLWLLFLIALLSLASIFNQLIFWLTFYFFLVLLLSSTLIIFLPLKQLIPKSSKEIIFTKGSKEPLILELSYKYQALSSLVQLTGDLLIAGDTYRVTYANHACQWDLAFLPRGTYPNPLIQLTVTDYFGLLKHQRCIQLDTHIVVLPKEQGVLAEKIYQRLSTASKKLLIADHMDNFQLKAFKPFRDGEDYHGIDWKLSAKKQTYIVKEVEKELKNAISLAFYGLPNPNFETTLGAFYDFQQTYQEALACSSVKLVTDKNKLISDPTLLNFAEVRPITDEVQALTSLLASLPEKNQLVIFTTDMTNYLEELLDNTEQNIFVILVRPQQKIDLYYS